MLDAPAYGGLQNCWERLYIFSSTILELFAPLRGIAILKLEQVEGPETLPELNPRHEECQDRGCVGSESGSFPELPFGSMLLFHFK